MSLTWCLTRILKSAMEPPERLDGQVAIVDRFVVDSHAVTATNLSDLFKARDPIGLDIVDVDMYPGPVWMHAVHDFRVSVGVD